MGKDAVYHIFDGQVPADRSPLHSLPQNPPEHVRRAVCREFFRIHLLPNHPVELGVAGHGMDEPQEAMAAVPREFDT